MQEPRKDLRAYLDRLIHRFLNAKSIAGQLKTIGEWGTPKGDGVLDLGAYFFQLASYSMSRTLFVELYLIVSEREDRSLRDWLRKAGEHASALGPTRSNRSISGNGREPVPVHEYREIVKEHLSLLDANSDLVDRLKSRRDKAIAHLDKSYFDGRKSIGADFPVSSAEIDDLISVISDILREHHSYVFESSLTMEISSARTVDQILRYARAWKRARSDKELIKEGFRPVDYIRDVYPSEEAYER